MGCIVAAHCDLRAAFGSARNQGARPTCLAFALSDAHTAARRTSDALSVEHLYYHAVQRTSGSDPEAGVALPAAREALRIDGQAREYAWPYLSSLPTDITHWKPPAGIAPLFRRETHPVAPCMQKIIAHLDAGEPLVLVMLLGERFYAPIDGLVSTGSNDSDTSYHAVIAVGYGRLPTGEICILVRNSWGEDWGLKGYCWLTQSYVELRIQRSLTMTSEVVA